MTDQTTEQRGDPRSGPELEFLQRWRPLIDRVGGEGGQARAAKHLNWTTSTVSRDYKGDTLPTDERLHQLCSSLQLSPHETLDLARLLRRARSDRPVWFGLSGPGAPSPAKPAAQAKTAVKGAFPGLALDAVQIPVASLSPSLARALRQDQTSHDAMITGFVFRNRKDPSLCLTAVNSGPKAGKNHDPVLVSACHRAANEIWVPEQWETTRSRFTHLVNNQYQTMCLNADNIGGLHVSHIVQLWDCYPAGNESWDFGDWHQAVSAGGRAYPLFVRSGRLCLDADKYDLRVGTPVRIWTQYATANQFWS